MKIVLFVLGFGLTAGISFAQMPDLSSPDLWKAANVPFSFTYNGKDSPAILPGWKATSENFTSGGHAVRRYIYTDPASHLQVTAEVRLFHDFPGAVDWVLRFKNEGTADTPIIENILPLHWSFPTQPGDCAVRHAKGSSAAADDFKPLEDHFGPNGNDHQESPDAGWYGHSIGSEQISSEQDPTSPWWLNRGDWYPSPLYYPNGIGPLGAACKANGLGFSLWIEPETSMPDRKIVNEHPDWFLHSDHPVNPGVMMANYGNPECLKGITDMVSGLITDFGMTMYRQDFNIPPADYWSPHDTPDRVGMTEIGHIEGLYTFLDTLLARHPGLLIDNCASGGRRFDIEMMSRSFVMGRSDHDADDPLANQALTQGLAPWNPQNSSFMTLAEDAPWSHGPPYSGSLSLYRLRIGYDNNCSFNVGATGVTNRDWIAWIKQAIGEYKDVQPYMYGDFYALTPYTLDDTVWTAWQYNRPDKKDGCIILLKRGSCFYTAMDLPLHHIDPNATYEVETRHTLDKDPVKEMKGSELANLRVTLNERPDSEIIFYRQK